jgi:tetratricopeptide (TPR) repeat protein
LLAFARDEQVEPWVRTQAAEALDRWGQVDDLLALARDEKVDDDVRFDAAKRAARLGRARDVVPSLLYLAAGPAAQDAEAWDILGRGLSDLERVREAIEAYERALKLNPTRAFTHNNLADALLEKARNDEAAEHYRRTVELEPDRALNAYAGLGAILWSQGRREKAREHFAAALAVFERAKIKRAQSPARLWMNRALALLGLGRPKQAEEALRKALAAREPGERVEVDARWRLLQKAKRAPKGLEDLISLIEEASEDVS